MHRLRYPLPCHPFCQFAKLIPSREFPTRWAKMQEFLKTPLPKVGVSNLGCLIAFVIAFGSVGTAFVMGINWLETHAPLHGPIIGGRALGKLAFFAALTVACLLALGICRVLSFVFPGSPTEVSTVATLSRYLAKDNRDASLAKAPWTRERIWRSTRIAIAEAYNIPVDRVTSDAILPSFGK
jgi:hypothetical protein